jgi:RNA polymerase sigma-70 factor (ECF subfamily)
MVPHLDAAYNLARWLTRDAADAEDVVQEAYLRAFRFFDGFHGGDARAWILKIVRNTCYSWLHKNRPFEIVSDFDEQQHAVDTSDHETMLIGKIDAQILGALIGELRVEFREVFILREMEGLSYKEIAEVAGLPVGTVMSRLTRARKKLQAGVTATMKEGPK